MAQETWNPRDLPVLDWLVERFDQDWETRLSPQEIAKGMGREVSDVKSALMALYSKTPALIVPEDEITPADTPPYAVMAVTAEARTATGAWPGSADSPARLAEALAALAEREPEGPEKTRLQKAAAAVGGVGQAALNAAISAAVGAAVN